MASDPSTLTKRASILDLVEKGVVLGDGAMGTMLYNRGIFVNRCFDELNLSAATLVKQVHLEYVDAGAHFIESNTYGANRYKLGPHGLDGQLSKINREGVRIAREAAGDNVLVAGAMGPLGKPLEPLGHISLADAVSAFTDQAAALNEGGVDFFLLETMPSLDMAKAALTAVRTVSDLPVIVSLTFTDEGATVIGESPESVVGALEAEGVQLIGANCSQGPNKMLHTVERMVSAAKTAKIMAMPNAGAPAYVDGRYVYLCTPEYIASYGRRFIEAGARMVGGCCGTTPAHIKNLARSLRMVAPVRAAPHVITVADPAKPSPPPIPKDDKSGLARKLGRKFVVSIELDPPKGVDPSRVIEKAHQCKENEVDAINVADGPRASARMSAQSLCLLTQAQTGLDTILHYTCRDRNLLGIQSDVLGCYALGLRNILCITGDPPKLGDYPDATAVYDVDSIGLIRILSHLNRGCDLAGNPIGPPLGIHIGCGADPSKPDWDKELRRLEEKVKAGAEYIMTQPVYDPRQVEKFLKAIQYLNTPVLIGSLPLYSHKNAEFLHNEVPGMIIPDDIRERMRMAGTGEKAQAEGVSIAQEALRAGQDLAQGVYVMPPFNRVDLALRVVEILR